MIRKLLHEPVLHFLLIGIAIFFVYGRAPSPDRDTRRIVVTQAVADSLATAYEAGRQRPPSEQELGALIEAYVRDEILYREGVALGLDRDDSVIKRRVRQKLEVIEEERQARDAPTDAELADFLVKQPDRFARPGSVSFEQIVLPGSLSTQEVEALRTVARTARDPGRLGQASMLPSQVDDLRLDLVARNFGPDFAGAIVQLPLNEWSGPVRSGYGLHLVRVTARTPATMPPLGEVRLAVARELENERRVASTGESYRKMRSQYQVVIEPRQVPSVATR